MKVFSILSISFFVLFASSCNQETQFTPPNIIFILADDLGYGDIEPFNENSQIPTPHLARLAANGMIFTDAHSTSSVCTPTRYSIMTGRYNWRSPLKAGVLTGKSKALIPPAMATIPSILQKAGYMTGFIGKWHLGWDWSLKDESEFGGLGWNPEDFDNIDFTKNIENSPNDIGFDYAYGHSGSLDMAPYVYVENERITAQPDRITVDTSKYGWWREGPTGADFDHDEVTQHFFEKSIDFVKQHQMSEDSYFLYLALPSPHTPILPSEEWQGKSGLNPYADFVMMIDDYVGKIIDAVDASSQSDNTLIIFTSDNGCSPAAKIEELEEKGHYPSHIYRGHKADIFEGGHRVPFIANWPAVISPGSKRDETISSIDALATFADIANVDIPLDTGVDSYSLLPLFENTEDRYQRETTIHHSINGSFAIRKGDWKLIMCPGSGGWSYPRSTDEEIIDTLPPLQLYNLQEDPGEKNNLINDNVIVAEELESLLINQIKNGRSTEGQKLKNDTSFTGQWKQIAFINED